MKKLLEFFRRGWAWCARRFSRTYGTCITHGDLPEKLKTKTLYIVYEEGFLWHASMLCPCGCNETIHLNLMADEKPYWYLTQHANKTVSLSPSIWRTKGCRSHFWIRKGEIIWCGNTVLEELQTRKPGRNKSAMEIFKNQG